MKTLNLLKDKAQHLSNVLPDGCVFAVGSAYSGYRLEFHDASGACTSSCGYETKTTALAQFSAVSTVLDGIHRSRCTNMAAENQLGDFRDKIEASCETLTEEISMLCNLAFELMLQMHQDKVIKISNQVIAEGYQLGLLQEPQHED